MRLQLFHLPGLVLAAVCVAASATVRAEQIYGFVDEAGVTHLSNVPSDPRYRPTAQVEPVAPGQPIQAQTEPQPTVEETAPGTPPHYEAITITPTAQGDQR